MELLYEAGSLPKTALPPQLAHLYAGDLGFDEPCLYANFVSTLDGVVAIPAMRNSNDFIAGDNDADRFVMGEPARCDVGRAPVVGDGPLRSSAACVLLRELRR